MDYFSYQSLLGIYQTTPMIFLCHTLEQSSSKWLSVLSIKNVTCALLFVSCRKILRNMLNRIISIYFFTLFIRAEAHLEYNAESDFNSNKLASRKKEQEPSYRLSPFVIPTNYIITLKPHFDEAEPEKKFTFDGSVIIRLEITRKVNEIILHSRELQFSFRDVFLTKIIEQNGREKNEEIQITINHDEERDFIRISNSSSYLSKGIYEIKINKYIGILNDDMRGFYKSSYKNEQGDTIYFAATHFEPIGARRAFPCFDEPKFKATFNLTIQHPINCSAISNMPAIKTTSNASISETVFDITLPMSTYSLAFVVSDFKSIGKDDFQVYAKPNALQYGQLALEMGEKLLKELETYTNVPFNLPKLDQIAIPGFVAGAMENWGLVTYREKSLLYDSKTSTTSEKQNIVETIAHEFSHQWFGDLVSPEWWKFLWLNEGFANFFQSYITEQVEPKWQSIYQSVVKFIQTTAFDFDSSNKAHPINQEVETPEEISTKFDSNSYQKAGAIIRMMQHFLGNNVFKRGLNVYLTENRFKSANSSHLFQALDDAASENNLKFEQKLESIMDTWINHKGYPIIKVTRNYNSQEIIIEQRQFRSRNETEENEENDYYWHIPINYATTKNQDFNNTSVKIWLSNSSKIVPLSIEPDEWIILNKQQTGFYRVNYDERNWQLIINFLNSDQRNNIHVLNRAQLINDALAFVKESTLTLTTLLRLTSYLTNETDYISWYPGFKSLSWIRERVGNTDHYPFFKEYALSITKNFVESVGLEESTKDGHIDKLKRIQAIHWSCSLGNKTCTEHFRIKLQHWIEQPQINSVSSDLKQVTLCEGLRTASFDLWKKIFNKCLNEASDDDEKFYLTSALGCSNNITILKYYLNYTLEQDSQLNDTFTVTRNIRDNSEAGVDVVLEFLINRFISLLLKYKNEERLRHLFNDVGEKITTKTQLDKLKAAKDIDIPTRITAYAIQAAEKNIKWIKQNEKILTDWKYNHNGATALSTQLCFILSSLLIVFSFIN